MTTYSAKPKTAAKVHIVPWPTALFFVGLFLLFLGERAFDREKVRQIIDGLGALAMLGGLGGLFMQRGATRDPDARTAFGYLVTGALVAVAGVALYFIFTLFGGGLRESLGKSFERVDAMAALLWPALVMLGALPMLFIQIALQSMTDGEGNAEHLDLMRVRYSAQSSLTLALVLVFCFAVNYTAAERNSKFDFARFRSTRPSEVTRKVIQNLSRPVRATLFFSNPNEVRELVEPYFRDLSSLGGRFTYEVLDHALEPVRAKELSATGNGLIVISQLDDKGNSAQRETINLGSTLEHAQGSLTTFDSDVQKRLLTLSRPGRIAYFTVGHGERGFDSGGNFDLEKDDLRAAVGVMRSLMQSQGYEVRTLGVGQGLSSQVPGDAGLVIIPGATEHFLAEEVAALTKYLTQGGHVYVLLDPSSELAATDLAPLLKAGGLKYHAQLLANDETYVPRTHKPSDKANVVSISFSSHVSVTALSRATGRVGVILPRSGWLERDAAPPAGVQIDFPLRSMPKTYADANSNFTFDSGEKQQVFELAAAAYKTLAEGGDAKVKKEMRLAVLGSVDAVSDLGMLNRANRFLALDTVKWLMQDEAITGETVQETDLPIVHTKDQDKLWFYSTIFAAPIVVLALGITYVRRVRRRRAS